MKHLIEKIEEIGHGDPVIFGWSNMRRRSKFTDEEAVVHLVKALLNSKNLAIRALDKRDQDKKVIPFKK
jgi:hypothetical protein